jgi:GNAT superfamily N-acetyltransferase
MASNVPGFIIRAAQPGEAPLIVAHRRAMFAEIRQLPIEQLDAMEAAFGPWVADRLAHGEYHGWFGESTTGVVVAGAGVWLMDWPPHMLHVEARRANLLNVYVQPIFRRRGLARALTETALNWCRQNGVRMVILHASDAGRPIYEALGFKATNEMSLLFEPGPMPGRPGDGA